MSDKASEANWRTELLVRSCGSRGRAEKTAEAVRFLEPSYRQTNVALANRILTPLDLFETVQGEV